VIVMPQTRPPDRAGATRSAEEKFLDLLLADDDLIRAEFDAIIAAEWSGSPPSPPRRRVRGGPDPGRIRRHRARATKGPGAGRRPPVEGSARQRSPPANDPRRNRAGGREVIARL
jgi:hypothetical protein